MANLYARILADHKHASREANTEVFTSVETWHEKVTVNLDRNGQCIVRRGPKQGTGEIIWTGDLNANPRGAS